MRRRIILLTVGLTTLVVLAFAIPLAILIRHTVYQRAVDGLQEDANRVAYFLNASQTAPSTQELFDYLADLGDDVCASVVQDDGRTVGCNPPRVEDLSTSPRPTRPGNGGGGGGPQRFAATDWAEGKIVQLPVFTGGTQPDPNSGEAADPDSQNIVRIYATDDQLHSGETEWWIALALASLGLLALGVVSAEIVTRRLVRPLTDTATTARRISAGDITARAPTRGPREIGDVGVALNQLADRIDELIADERETVADLSHRLRTPLTVLRLEAEGLNDPEERERIGGEVTEVERTLTAVIRAARRPQREGRLPACDATEVVSERVEFWSALAEDQDRPRRVELPREPLPVRAATDDLAAAVDALVENVIAHTPEGTAFAVTLTATPGGARLMVADDGPGIPEGATQRGRSDRNSTGLGLDVARRCAENSGGAMSIGTSSSGGAVVILELGAAGPAEPPPSGT